MLNYSWTYHNRPPKMSSQGGRLWEVVTYESLDHNGSKFSSLKYGSCRVLAHPPMPMQCFIYVKVNFKKKKICSSHWEISVSCTGQKYGNVTTSCFYPVFALLSVKWLACENSRPPSLPATRTGIEGRLLSQAIKWSPSEVKNKGKFQTLALKVVAVAYERWSFTRGSRCSDLTWNETFWCFEKLIAVERRSVTRCGRTQKFDSIHRNIT